MHKHALAELRAARYVLLRSFRRDGTPIDTPIWFGLDGDALLFRTKMGPKTRRLATRRDVELAACDYRGRVQPGATTVAGQEAGEPLLFVPHVEPPPARLDEPELPPSQPQQPS